MNTLTDTAHACYLDSFVLAEDFNQHVQGKLLSPLLWEIAQALKAPHNAAAIGVQLQLPAETVLSGLKKLEAAGLVSTYQIQCPWLKQEDAAAAPACDTKQASTAMASELVTKEPTSKASLAQIIALTSPQPAQAEASVNAALKEEPAQGGAQLVALPGRQSTQLEAPVLAPVIQKPSQVEKPVLVLAPANQQPAQSEFPARSSIKLSMAARARVAKQAPAIKQLAEKPVEGTTQLCAQAPGAISLKLCATRKAPGQSKQEAALQSGESTTNLASPKASTQEKNLCWAIQPVLDALRLKAGGDPMVGQLLAYRVFLRIPKELLEAAGIRSVCLIEPDLVIRDQNLKRAIETALRDVANIGWPTAVSSAV